MRNGVDESPARTQDFRELGRAIQKIGDLFENPSKIELLVQDKDYKLSIRRIRNTPISKSVGWYTYYVVFFISLALEITGNLISDMIWLIPNSVMKTTIIALILVVGLIGGLLLQRRK